MLKLPKGLKKKKKGKKSKRKEEELFTEEELEKYKREHQQQNSFAGEGAAKENEEWSKFKDLTTGIDTVLKKTQGDLDRIKSTSFFQRVPTGPKKVEPVPNKAPHRPVVEITEADFPQLVAAAAASAVDAEDEDRSDYGVTDDESEEDDQDDIFDTSYVDAVERGEVKLAYVPDSPEEFQDDDIFDTSHVDALIKGQEAKTLKGKKGLDIGIAVEVLTGRIDNVAIATKRPSKRVIPGDLLLKDSTGTGAPPPAATVAAPESVEKSILDLDSDIPITSPIDLSVSLHTSLLPQNTQIQLVLFPGEQYSGPQVDAGDEIDEFTLLATESLEVSAEVTKFEQKQIEVEPVLQESWSAFEADKHESVFTESIIEDEIDVVDPYIDGDDPFDTSFTDAIISPFQLKEVKKEAVILEDDDDFDPRAEEIQVILNNRRKSSVRIHLTDPSGVRESITSDDIIDSHKGEEFSSRDLLGSSTTDLTQLGDSPLDPVELNNDFDPFDTSIVDKIVAPGKIELKFLEQELIGGTPAPISIYRIPSDPDFDPRAEETKKSERRPSRPENLTVSKSVIFNVEGQTSLEADTKVKNIKPLTPYYTREVSITEDLNEEAEAADTFQETLTRTRSDEDIAPKTGYHTKRRHSEYPQASHAKVRASDLLHSGPSDIKAKVLTPTGPVVPEKEPDTDPFDTSFASNIAPGKNELKLLAKEFSCEESGSLELTTEPDLLEPDDDLFHIKALTPEPSEINKQEDFDPFDTSFADDLNPGRTELKLLESEFLNH